jgi:hypothetical protein
VIYSPVRTIVGRKNGTDRTTKARREKIEIDKFQRALEVAEANRRCTAPAGSGRDRDRQGAGAGSQGVGPGALTYPASCASATSNEQHEISTS